MAHHGGSRPKEPCQDTAGEQYQPTVLVVEDDEDVRFAMVRLLAEEGYLVLTASTARDALGVLQSPLSAIDVAVLDINLPDASGTHLCARLRERFPGTPVIICTGKATPEEAEELMRLGVHRYFRKPVSADELLASVEAVLP
jgi:DNA-binding NtrC family response regulator